MCRSVAHVAMCWGPQLGPAAVRCSSAFAHVAMCGLCVQAIQRDFGMDAGDIRRVLGLWQVQRRRHRMALWPPARTHPHTS